MNTVGFREAAITAAVENGGIGGGREVGLDDIGDLSGGSSRGYGVVTMRKGAGDCGYGVA